jgi:hypothetical protein
MEVNMPLINYKNFSLFRPGKTFALSLPTALSLVGVAILSLPPQLTPAAQAAPAATTKPATDKAPENKDKDKEKEKDKDKKEATKPAPEPVIENVVSVPAETLVDHPAEYLNKNVKFTALFYGYNSLATDYKPAMKSSKTYLSFSVLREHSKVPLSELKLAMLNPKEEKSKLTELLLKLKEKDEIEVIGKVYATALDEPWVEVLKLNLIKAAPDEKKADGGSTPATK